MRFLTFKWLTVPESNETRQQQVVQLWEVRWESRYGEYTRDVRPELECFTSEAEARSFATALTNAFKLVKHTSGTNVSVKRAAS